MDWNVRTDHGTGRVRRIKLVAISFEEERFLGRMMEMAESERGSLAVRAGKGRVSRMSVRRCRGKGL